MRDRSCPWLVRGGRSAAPLSRHPPVPPPPGLPRVRSSRAADGEGAGHSGAAPGCLQRPPEGPPAASLSSGAAARAREATLAATVPAEVSGPDC